MNNIDKEAQKAFREAGFYAGGNNIDKIIEEFDDKYEYANENIALVGKGDVKDWLKQTLKEFEKEIRNKFIEDIKKEKDNLVAEKFIKI